MEAWVQDMPHWPRSLDPNGPPPLYSVYKELRQPRQRRRQWTRHKKQPAINLRSFQLYIVHVASLNMSEADESFWY